MRVLRVWDLPTRLFHWALVLGVVALVITGEIGGNAMVWHFRAGYAVLTLLLFRLVWGVLGGHWSRFATFFYGPGTIWRYLKGDVQPAHHVGHNPLGSLSVWGLLTVLLAQVGSGLFSDDEIAATGPLTRFVSGDTVSLLTEYHTEVGKGILIGLVLLHVAAIVFYARQKGENLVRPMVLGDKAVPKAWGELPSAQDDTPRRLLAAVMLALCAGGVYWIAGLGG